MAYVLRKANNSAEVQGTTATQTVTESQITQYVRGYVSAKLCLSFSKPVSLEPTLHCSLCSPARASLQYETIFSFVGYNHRCGFSQSGATDPFATISSYERFTCLLLGEVTVHRWLLVHRRVLAKHPRDIHLRHPWWPDCVEVHHCAGANPPFRAISLAAFNHSLRIMSMGSLLEAHVSLLTFDVMFLSVAPRRATLPIC